MHYIDYLSDYLSFKTRFKQTERPTDRQTDGRTLSGIELLLQLKIGMEMLKTNQNLFFHLQYEGTYGPNLDNDTLFTTFLHF